MSKILYINNNDFHHLGRSQICAGAWYVFRISKPHSERLCIIITSPQSITLIFSLATVSSDTSSPVSTRTFWLTNCSVTGSKTFPRKTVSIFSQCYDWRCGGSVLLFLNKHSLIRSKCELSSSSPILHTSSSAHLHFDK